MAIFLKKYIKNIHIYTIKIIKQEVNQKLTISISEMQDDLILPNPSVLSTYPVPGDAPSDGNQGIMSERETVITDTREAYLSSNSECKYLFSLSINLQG